MGRVALIIGSSGGIGQALALQIQQAGYDKVYAVSRRGRRHDDWSSAVHAVALDSQDEQQIARFIGELRASNETVALAVCTVGVLHSDTLVPEKRLEDISAEQLNTYFQVNTIIPGLWVKHLVSVMAKDRATLVCISARVGSISDNQLGGWYGYRASKAALNMMLKSAAVEYGRRAKGTTLVSYHPGTVDTALSAPFQHNVAAEKLFTADYTAGQLLQHITALGVEGSPHFIDWAGKPVSW